MSFRSIFTAASILALTSAGPLPADIAAVLKRQPALPSEFPAVPNPVNPTVPGVLPTGSIPATTVPGATQLTGILPGTSIPAQTQPTGILPGSTAPAAIPTGSSGGNSSAGPVSAKGSVEGSLAVTSINGDDGIGAGEDAYIFYKGDGSVGAGWPAADKWVSFSDMFEANKAVMKTSCSSIFQLEDNTDEEISAIQSSIDSVAEATKVDHRFILAVIMQESKGCVRVKTTNYGVNNPGLMQDHDGVASCNDGTPISPCPADTITQMISEGTGGTAKGDGLAQLVNQAGDKEVSAFYKASRMYNSGSIDPSGDLGAGIATHCYASDVANRLTGWVQAETACPLETTPGK